MKRGLHLPEHIREVFFEDVGGEFGSPLADTTRHVEILGVNELVFFSLGLKFV